jgi:hypothetical protein
MSDDDSSEEVSVCNIVKFTCSIDNYEVSNYIREIIASRFEMFPIEKHGDVTEDLACIRYWIDKKSIIVTIDAVHYWKRCAIQEDILPDAEADEGYEAFKINCVILDQRKSPRSYRYLHIEMQLMYEKEI